MKHIYFIITVLLLSTFVTTNAYAVSITTTPVDATPSSTLAPKPTNQEQSLKEKIVKLVPQLKLVEKRGFIGTVSDLSQTKITINDVNNNIHYIDVDEFTKFASPSAKSNFGISDITKGTVIGALGRYNRESHRLLARTVEVMTLSSVMSGVITAIDSKNFVLTIATEKNPKMAVDVETITKTLSLESDGQLKKTGFSKIVVNERLIVTGFRDITNPSHMMASRIVLLPTLPKNPAIAVSAQPIVLDTTESITPSTGSGKKVAPLN